MNKTRRVAPAGLVAACLLWSAATCAADNSQATPEQEIPEQETMAWQARRNSGLTETDGWLALAGLWPLTPGKHAMGSAATAAIRLPLPAPAHVGELRVTAAGVDFLVPATGPPATLRFEPPAASASERVVRLLADGAEDGPTVMHLGPLSCWVIERVGSLWLRVSNDNHPALQHPTPLAFYPIASDWRVAAVLQGHETEVAVPTVLGVPLLEQTAGELTFQLHGENHSLHALKGTDGRLFVIFSDETNTAMQDGTYGSGRFLWVERPDSNGRTMVDFNRAYNPPCAFTPFATCPLPPPGNHLPVPVRAGEKRWSGTAH